MPLIEISFSILMLFFIQMYISKITWRKNLDVKISFDQDSVIEGETVGIIETVANYKRIPVASLKVNLNIDKHIQFLNQINTVLTDRSCHSEVFALAPRNIVERKMECFCSKRGYYQIDSVYLVSNDLFYTQKMFDNVPQKTALYVYPGKVDQVQMAAASERILGQIFSKRQIVEDPFEFRGIRKYEPFDSMRSINWKISAKMGELRVNMYENMAEQEVRILLDVGCDMLVLQESLVEEGIRIASALSEEFIKKSIVTALITNGTDGMLETPLSIMGGAGDHHMIQIKRGLSRLSGYEKTADIPIEHILRKEADRTEQTGKKIFYIFISGETTPSIVKEWNHLCENGVLNWWIMPVHRKEEEYKPELLQSEIIYWRVPYGK